jgi:outer membrane protein assembly factor BamE (lipoprotein component of BamABCDE complex)
MDGGTFHYPSTSGPPAEMAGLTKDGVTRVQIVLNGTPHNAVFGHNAWYYRFPNNQIRATVATKLLVTLSDGSTKTIPTRITGPPA